MSLVSSFAGTAIVITAAGLTINGPYGTIEGFAPWSQGSSHNSEEPLDFEHQGCTLSIDTGAPRQAPTHNLAVSSLEPKDLSLEMFSWFRSAESALTQVIREAKLHVGVTSLEEALTAALLNSEETARAKLNPTPALTTFLNKILGIIEKEALDPEALTTEKLSDLRKSTPSTRDYLSQKLLPFASVVISQESQEVLDSLRDEDWTYLVEKIYSLGIFAWPLTPALIKERQQTHPKLYRLFEGGP